MFDENNSPNGFNVHRYDSENENVNEFDINVRGSMMNKNEYYPDFYERQRYEKQRLQNEVQISPVSKPVTQWDIETKESQRKLNELQNNNNGVVINKQSDDVMDPNTFFNNSSQIYLLYNVADKLGK